MQAVWVFAETSVPIHLNVIRKTRDQPIPFHALKTVEEKGLCPGT